MPTPASHPVIVSISGVGLYSHWTDGEVEDPSDQVDEQLQDGQVGSDHVGE